MCRKAHGAGYVTWLGFENEQVVFTRGDNHLKWYESSAGADRGFCDVCGSTLLFRSEQWKNELHNAAGSLDCEMDRQPQANVFFDKHVEWMPIDKNLKQIDG
jgi:hypothetical protein